MTKKRYQYLEHSKEYWIRTHSPDKCAGGYCVVHNMSDHSMRSFPQHYRSDRGITERICPHGAGHPDFDDPKAKDKYESIHGCCGHGCCE